MTPDERELVLLLAKTLYGSLETPFSLRRQIRDLMDKVKVPTDGTG